MIRKYEPADFPLLQSWVTDPKDLFTFAGPSWAYPLTESQVEAHQEKFPHKQLYLGLDESGQPFAIGEIILREVHAPRLGRLLVGDPLKRGKGLGWQFIRELILECLEIHPTEQISLFVLQENQQAIKTYLNLGFQFSPEDIPDMHFNGQAFLVRKMVLDTKSFT